MNTFLRLSVALACLGASAAEARDLSALYDRAVLDHWKPRYERSTTKILTDVILPVLTEEEKRRVGGFPRIDFPLHAEGQLKGRPLMFYVPSDGARVVMPIFSLKFLDDLCTAYAWLQVNSFSLETISEYTAMLRYKEPRGGRHPAPLPALHIPPNALEDRRVDELALGHFVTARTWLLLHELGHVYHRHAPRSFAESRRNEQQADEFATRVMRRTPLPPLGILVFFMADAHWAGYPSADEDSHPLSGARVRTLAGAVDDRGLATGLRALAELLDDADIRAGFVATGKAADASTLVPRRPGALPRPSPGPGAEAARLAFQGRYVGESVQSTDPRPFPADTVLERRGDRVNGRYTFGLGVGTLEGVVAGNTLRFSWSWAGNYGRGVFEASPDGQGFSGTWGYRESADNAGSWQGQRKN